MTRTRFAFCGLAAVLLSVLFVGGCAQKAALTDKSPPSAADARPAPLAPPSPKHVRSSVKMGTND